MNRDDRPFPDQAPRRTGIMYQNYFGIEENPFSLTPDPRYLYMTNGHQEALAHLLYGVSEGGGFVLLTGEVGTGKTSVCRCLLEQLPAEAEVALILNPRLSEIELLANICDELGIKRPKTSSLKVMVDLLNEHLLRLHADGRHAALIIDEAQNLSPDVLEQVRLLTNLETDKRKLLQIILIGQPELDDLLNRTELRQLAQRITSRTHLEPLSATETTAYMAHRLDVAGLSAAIFSPGARAEVYRCSGGVPRLINSLCDRCLLAAYAQETKQVDRKMVRAAAAEVFGRRVKARGHGRTILPYAVATAAAAAVVIGFLGPRDFSLSGVLPNVSIVAEAPETPSSGAERPALRDADAAMANEQVAGEVELSAAASRPLAVSAALAAPVATNHASAALPADEIGSKVTSAVEQTAALPQDEESGDAPPTQMITLDQLFALGAFTGSRERGLVRLFGLWQRDYGALAGREACDKAREGGLRCLTGKPSLQGLIAFNRPALLTLESPKGDRIHAVLTGLDGTRMTLEVGDQQVRASAMDIAAIWSGNYLLLWRPPEAYQDTMKGGDKGADVAWLKNRLAELAGEPVEPVAEATFDAALEARVISFQRSHPLSVDGIVGPQTLIHLNNAVGAPDVAVLAARS